MENKVLIITYYWPPSGGSGVQRWLKFAKYLPSFGWKPYIFTPANPSFAIRDESLLRDVPKEAQVIHFPIWEPYEAFFKLSGLLGNKKSAKPTELVSGKKKSLFQKVSTWVRGNLFIPDPRVFWVKPSVRFLLKYVQEQGIKTIITTGPPHSVHLIGLKLKRKNPSLKWLADFRDPWSDWGLLDSLMVGGIARSMHRRLEAQVVKMADVVITITPFYVRKFEKLSGRPVRLLTNGFDEDDFKNLVITRHTKFIIRHAGIVNEKCDPRPFMLAVKSLLQEQPELREKLQIDFVGEVHPDFRAFVQQDDDLKSITTFTPTIPHKQLMALYGESAVMLLVLTGYKDAEGYMPGKLFEYLATGLPVLGVGPEQGDAAALLNISGAGVMIDGNHTAAIKIFIQQKFNAWKSTDSIAKAPGSQIYSRRAITQTLTEML
ncbi:MAG TPA: glycosyl transferase [Ohtaekwangia sp.]|uniref:glycosyl transferase n=1 Tax=Ohtaekwangia sp. TaxID=2066019 RepID=UPI002F94C2E5